MVIAIDDCSDAMNLQQLHTSWARSWHSHVGVCFVESHDYHGQMRVYSMLLCP